MTPTALMLILAVLVGVPLGIAGLVYVVVPACKGATWVVGRVFTFIFREIGDVLRVVGGLVSSLVLVPLTAGSVLVGRWSAASHYGRAIQRELTAIGRSLYRIGVGHPARLLCLGALTEGIEKRIPEVVARAPGADFPSGRIGQFDGYTIVGSLPGGGSGGRLYIAEPTAGKLAALARAGTPDVRQVVIKCFSLRDGSSLPQIVRENRALPAAKRLGLILEHELTDERFFYVMRYVPGEPLGIVTQRLHAESGGDGLGSGQLREALEYAADLARTLCHYHDGGLWHKDVKPDNIIISGGQAHLVDFGLITPLRSSLTLTTHGTEYFRDPEMVRLALRGVKVHEVDGAKFDIYAAGAVLYSVVENSFPAHGGLSQITRRCPEAVRWIVRRAMTDYDKRYTSAEAMLRDLEAVLTAADPFALKPAMLPSFREGDDLAAIGPAPRHEWEAVGGRMGGAGVVSAVGAGSPVPPPVPAIRAAGAAPRLRVTSWWTGRYELAPDAPGLAGHSPAGFARPPRVPGATAAEQLARARERARAAQARAHSRMRGYTPEKFKPVNAGVGVAVLAFLVVVGAITYLAVGFGQRRPVSIAQDLGDGTSRVVRIGPEGISISARTPAAEPADEPQVSIDPAIGVEQTVERATRGEGGRLMVLRDPVSFESAVRERIDAQVAALRAAGFDLRGNCDAGAAGVDEGEVETMAELRSDLGVTPFSTPEARGIIEQWLASHTRFDAVVWIGRADDSLPAAWVVGRRGLAERTMDRATKSLAVGKGDK